MVQKIFKVEKSADSATGWVIIDTDTDTVLDLPEICKEDLSGRYITSDELLDKIDTVQIALSGVTDSLRVLDTTNLNRRSVLKTFALKQTDTIDDTIDGFLESVRDYEKYHTIEMGRDVVGNDNTIHAYIETPKDGKLRCRFDRDVRLYAKRNNVRYWISDYKIEAGSNGGKFVIPLEDPEEIL